MEKREGRDRFCATMVSEALPKETMEQTVRKKRERSEECSCPTICTIFNKHGSVKDRISSGQVSQMMAITSMALLAIRLDSSTVFRNCIELRWGWMRSLHRVKRMENTKTRPRARCERRTDLQSRSTLAWIVSEGSMRRGKSKPGRHCTVWTESWSGQQSDTAVRKSMEKRISVGFGDC